MRFSPVFFSGESSFSGINRMASQVDQALSNLKKAEDYIKAGLVALPEYASEFADVNTEDQSQIIDEYRALMKRYATMGNEYRAYMSSVNDSKCLVSVT